MRFSPLGGHGRSGSGRVSVASLRFAGWSLRTFARASGLFVVAALFVFLLAPGCGRTSLEPETLDGGRSANCGPSNCPNGCCDANGQCRVGSDTRACGSAGGRCSDCVGNGFTLCTRSRVCGRDDEACSATTCAGCCAIDEGRRRCLSGTEPSACGRRGSTCSDCGSQGRSCDANTGACGAGSCNSQNCNGCCVGDKCLLGTDVSSCGEDGRACTTCAVGQTCQPTGDGGRCVGTPTCGPDNCSGCCTDAGQCITGADATACGKGGAKCSACVPGQTCAPLGSPNERTCQTLPTCGPGNCAGCCAPGNQCVIATTAGACGRDGQACTACAPGNTCNAGVCQPTAGCSAANCAGCCIGDICAVGSQNTACGIAGEACENCSSTAKVCQGGDCVQPACGPGNCAGCCAGNTCVVGTQDNACGPANGQACNDCTATNKICQNRACVDKCGPANCPTGCCTTANACALGFENSQCGAGGAACANCTLVPGSFCNGLVDPRRCNNQQNTCPAPYLVCPPGTTTPVTATLQNLCSEADLDKLAAACANAPTDAGCVTAMGEVANACRTCVAPFNVPFETMTGLHRCAAPSVDAGCRVAMACVVDCLDDSCDTCEAGKRSQCRDLVDNPGRACNAYAVAASCANDALEVGKLCSQFSYPQFGQWLRAVGDHFCGNGP